MSFSAMMKAVKEKQLQQQGSIADEGPASSSATSGTTQCRVGMDVPASPTPDKPLDPCEAAPCKDILISPSHDCGVSETIDVKVPPEGTSLPEGEVEAPPIIPLRKAVVAQQRVSCVDRLFGKREKRAREEKESSSAAQPPSAPKPSSSRPVLSKFAEKLRSKELSFC